MKERAITHHYVNLVSWRYFSEDNWRKDRKCYVDSVSMQLVCYLLTGAMLKRESGVDRYQNILTNSINNVFFLVAKSGHSPSKNYTVLPFWRTPGEVQGQILNTDCFENYPVIVIGISSPKQDVLADELRNLTQCSDIYCLGAAVGQNQGTGIFDKLGLNFLYFFCFNPLRTMNKLKLTFLSASKILFIKKERLLFKSFCKYYFTREPNVRNL